jgi:DNA polymerase alpha subunit A
MSIWTHGLMHQYYQGVFRCDEPSCGLETRQLSVAGAVCLRRACPGTMHPAMTERIVHTHLKYLERLVHLDHTASQLGLKEKYGNKPELLKLLPKHDKSTFEELHEVAQKSLEATAFNWITPTFWKGLFHVGSKQ